jgi:hypothetical protein
MGKKKKQRTAIRINFCFVSSILNCIFVKLCPVIQDPISIGSIIDGVVYEIIASKALPNPSVLPNK